MTQKQNARPGGRAGDETYLIESKMGMVRAMAKRLAGTLMGSVSVEDMISAGYVGLVQAARRFDPAAGARFETFAVSRVRGAMLDEIRKMDWMSRWFRDKTMPVLKRHLMLPTEYPAPEEGGKMRMLDDNLMAELSDTGASRIFGVDMEREEMAVLLGLLEEEQRSIIIMHYFAGWKTKEISLLLGVSPARVLRLHRWALAALRRAIRTRRGDIV